MGWLRCKKKVLRAGTKINTGKEASEQAFTLIFFSNGYSEQTLSIQTDNFDGPAPLKSPQTAEVQH
jgi:hypothetical protein